MTACKVLADEYEMAGQTDLATDLRKDAASMRLAVMHGPAQARRHEGGGGLNNADYDGGVLYANRRFFIPWGWCANAVSSLCSTSWSIFEDFNPFVMGGNSTNFPGSKKVPRRSSVSRRWRRARVLSSTG